MNVFRETYHARRDCEHGSQGQCLVRVRVKHLVLDIHVFIIYKQMIYVHY
jgi:hypothetical protein